MTDFEKPVSTTSENMPRREFIRKSLMASGGVFVSMTAGEKLLLPALTGSNMPERPASRAGCNNGVGNGQDCLPPGNPPNNDDDPEDGPGNPGNQGGFKN